MSEYILYQCSKLYDYVFKQYPELIRDNEGNVYYRDASGKTHRDNDLPAVMYTEGTQKWFKHGMPHRDNDLPAAMYADGTLQWYSHGELHREGDQPAEITSKGNQR